MYLNTISFLPWYARPKIDIHQFTMGLGFRATAMSMDENISTLVVRRNKQHPTGAPCRMDDIWTRRNFFIVFLSHS
jgi:hypothetical protein